MANVWRSSSTRALLWKWNRVYLAPGLRSFTVTFAGVTLRGGCLTNGFQSFTVAGDPNGTRSGMTPNSSWTPAGSYTETYYNASAGCSGTPITQTTLQLLLNFNCDNTLDIFLITRGMVWKVFAARVDLCAAVDAGGTVTASNTATATTGFAGTGGTVTVTLEC